MRTEKVNFKEMAKMIVKQVAGSERLVCFVTHVANDVVVTVGHYMLVIPQELFKLDFQTDKKLGRYENFFYDMDCNIDYCVRHDYGNTVEVNTVEVYQETNERILKAYNDYFTVGLDEDDSDKFIPARETTVNINSNDKTFTVFKRQNKSLLCFNKTYIDIIKTTPLKDVLGCSTVTLNDDARYNPICYRTCYGEVDNKYRFHGFLVLPCRVDADSVLKHVLGME